ncbi:MAG: hypothetical protein JWM02_162 [Frankiales bacterium]|nr:hypothetical protein [Frankiales bacterium]
MNRTKWALTAAVVVACVGQQGGLQRTVPAVMTGHVLTQVNPVVTDAAVPAVSVRCRTNAKPLAVLAARGRPGQRASYGTFVNRVRTHTGMLTADRRGTFTTSTAVTDHRRVGVILQLSSRTVVNAAVTPSCSKLMVATPPAPAPTATSGSRGNATSYTLNYSRNGAVTRWDPCAGDIHVRVNAANGGTGALADAQAALSALSSGTGLHFVYDGSTTFVPSTGNSSSQPATVVIAWAAPGTGAGTSDYYESGAIGEGGWRSSGTSTDGGATWNWKIVQGFVVVDPGASLPGGFGNGATRGALLLHELGHVAGLGHTSDGSQVMYPMLGPSTVGSYGAGDLAGLTAVGAAKGCTTAS